METTEDVEALQGINFHRLSALVEGVGELIACPDLEERVIQVDPGHLRPYPGQPRQNFPEAEIKELADKIQKDGQQIPIVTGTCITESGEICFVIVDGERRWRAISRLGLDTASILVRKYSSEADIYRAAASTHKDSSSLNNCERHLMLGRLYLLELERRGTLTVVEYAQEIGINYNMIHNGLRLVALPEQLRLWGIQGVLTVSGLIRIENARRQYEDASKGSSRKKCSEKFPMEDLITNIANLIQSSKKSVPESEVRKLIDKVLISGGLGDEAMERRISEASMYVGQKVRLLLEGLITLDGEIEGVDDEILRKVLKGLTPHQLRKLLADTEQLSVLLSNFRQSLELAQNGQEESSK